MTREEFIQAATNSGYCRKRTAREFAEGRESLTDGDFIEVFRLEQVREEREHSRRRDGMKAIENGWTSEDYRGGRSSDKAI